MADEGIDPSILGIDNSDQGVQTEDQQGQQSDNDSGQGNEGNAPETYKIGDKEYTAEQLQAFEKKAGDYDALLPDYTRKSQELAKYNKNNNGQDAGDDKPSYLKENWQPKTYQELGQAIQQAEERGMKRAVDFFEGKERSRAEAKQQWDGFVSETQKADKSFDKKDFADYISRHNIPVSGIESIKSAYGMYKEMIDLKIAKGGNSKAQSGVSPSQGGKAPTAGVPYNTIHNSRNSVDLIQRMFNKN